MLRSLCDLSLGHFFVLFLLGCDGPRAMRLTELADRTHFTLSGISRIVQTLTQRGLVERQPDPSDGRALLIAMTDAGSALLQETEPDIAGLIRRRFLDHFTGDELKTMIGFWSRLNL